MDVLWLADRIGDAGVNAVGGLLIGAMFGFFAQRSRFCLRAATVEFWRGSLGPKTTVWLLVFGSALLGTQLLFEFGQLEDGNVRQLAQSGTLSGAMIGGLMFGAGMILARGCASRLLVLSATGNLRALLAGLILTVVAQASLRGALSPARQSLSSVWLVEADARNLMAQLPDYSGLVLGSAAVMFAIVLWRQLGMSIASLAAAIGVGATIVLGWWFTAHLSAQAFDVIAIQSVSFTGPSTDTLMAFINEPNVTLSFGLGLVPGVFAGSLVAALLTGEFKIQSFGENAPLPRYIVGAVLMGFGSMLAGGCAVGAGVTGGAVLALTSWVALAAMWVGAGLADLVFDRRSDNLKQRRFVPVAPA